MQFQIEAKPRAPADRTFGAWYQIEEPAAIEESMRRFREQNPGKNVAVYEFRVIRS